MSYNPPIVAFEDATTPTHTAYARTLHLARTTGGVIAVNLPDLTVAANAWMDGELVEIFDEDQNAATNNITITRGGASDTIASPGVAGATTFVMALDGQAVTLRADVTNGKWWVIANTAGSAGEANTASNVGSGAGVFKQKTGVDLEFKSMIGGHKLAITSNTNDLTLDSRFAINAVLTGNTTAAVGTIYPTDSSGGAFTVTLPAGHVAGDEIIIKDSNESSKGADQVIIDADSAETIDGDLTVVLSRGGALKVTSDGTNWYIV